MQDVSQAESTLNQVSSEVPKFVSKYKNLNLLIAGFQTSTQLPAQVLALKESFATIKKGDAQSVANGLLDLRTKVNGLVEMMRTAFQRPR